MLHEEDEDTNELNSGNQDEADELYEHFKLLVDKGQYFS